MTTMTTAPELTYDLVQLILAMDNWSIDAPSAADRQKAQKLADELRERHLRLFHAEFTQRTSQYKAAVAELEAEVARAKVVMKDIQKLARFLESARKVVAVVDTILGHAAKIGIV